MSDRLSDVRRQRDSVAQLKTIVIAMRGMAASRAQSARSLVPGIRAYADAISRAIGQALRMIDHDHRVPPHVRRENSCLILFCAEQGFAGAFNERILDAARKRPNAKAILVIGTRGIALAGERRLALAWSAPMVTHIEGIPSLANEVAEALYELIENAGVNRVDMVFARATSGGSAVRIECRSLIPIDFERFTLPINQDAPITTLAPTVLLDRLAVEYVYAQICEVAMQAFAAENESRMMVMTAAKANIEAKLDVLSRRENELRQQEITAEVVELTAGRQAISNDESPARVKAPPRPSS